MGSLKPLKSRPLCRKQDGETFMKEAKVANPSTSIASNIGKELEIVEKDVEEGMEEIFGTC